ncbi:PKD domain-containing protein [Chloroflexota bacterium]
MKINRKHRSIRTIIKLTVALAIVFSQFGWAVGEAHAENPTFTVSTGDAVALNYWPTGATIVIDVDDPATILNPDISRTVTADSWGSSYINLIGVFDIQTGFTITVSDGNTLKSTTISHEITDVNAGEDTISGVAEPGSVVIVEGSDDSTVVRRTVTADSNGVWQADFSIPGDDLSESDTLDLLKGMNIGAYQVDNDGDKVFVSWSIPNPRFLVLPETNDEVRVFEWPAGSEIIVTVDDPDTDLSPDISRVVTVDANGYSRIFFNHIFDIQTGFTITVSDGDTLKTLTISLEITELNPSEDTISGTAEPGSYVNISACPGCYSRSLIVDSSGLWQVDFSVPGGPGQTQIVDIVVGTQGSAKQYNNDDDFAMISYEVPDTRFQVCLDRDSTESYQWLEAYEWPAGSELTVTIDDPDTVLNPDYSRTATAYPNGALTFDLNGAIDIQPGFTIIVSDGVNLKSTIISLEISELSISEDTVSGIAEPFSTVNLLGCSIELCSSRTTTADSEGSWTEDFSIPGTVWDAYPSYAGIVDLDAGSSVRAIQTDIDGDITHASIRIPIPLNPIIIAVPAWNVVVAKDWFPDTPEVTELELTITIDDPGTGLNPDVTRSVMIGPPEGENAVYIDFNDEIDIQTGFTISVTDGSTVKSTIISLEISATNQNKDIIYGFAEPGSIIEIEATYEESFAYRLEMVDSTGFWKADFSIPGDDEPEGDTLDLTADTEVLITQTDTDGDITYMEWTVPFGSIIADAGSNQNLDEGTSGSLSGVGSNDPDGDPLSFNWELVSSGLGITLSGMDTMTPTYQTTDNGIHILKLTVDDGNGHSTSDYVFLTVNNVGPTIESVIAPSNPVEVNSLIMVSADFTDPGTSDTHLAIVSWGDEVDDVVNCVDTIVIDGSTVCTGTVTESNGSGTMTFNHIYDSPGVYDLIIYLFDDDFNFDSPDETQFAVEELTVQVIIPPDNDNDGIPDNLDNAPDNYNPDQRDVDSDGIADVLDPCPADPEDECDALGSTAVVVGEVGGTVVTENEKVTLDIPAGDMTEPITFSITDGGSGYEIVGDQEPLLVVNSYSLQPHGTVFTTPATLTFGWNDSDNNGLVDGTTSLLETDLVLFKDSFPITPVCSENPDCDVINNIMTVQVYSLSLFELAAQQNHPPVANAGPDLEILEGGSVTLDASTSSDPDGNQLTFAWDLDNDGQYVDGTEVTADATFPDNGTYTVGLKVSDPLGLSSVDSVSITVTNVAPVIETLIAPIEPIDLASEVNAEATFTDPGADTFTTTWDWGDGTTTEGEIDNFTVNGSHTYTDPGVYTLTLTVTDDDGGSATASFQYIVVYDPEGGFVTGGGWIWSPEGAYADALTLSGKATFGFVSKYKKGANIPTGNTEFQFKVADFNFRSTSYDWLVVAGKKAQFKGIGTINGSGEYGFMLTATDSDLLGGDKLDSFRIKIWDLSSGEMVYDNQMGALDDAEPATELGGGSIVIHK